MIPILFKKDEKQFRTYGIGELSDFTLSPEVRRERNGLYTFYMEYAPNGVLADQLDEGMKIKSDAGVRTKWQTFEINRVVKRSGENIQVYANHISMRTAKDVIKPKVSGSNLDGQGLLRLWANNLVGDDQWDVWSDVSTQVSVNWSIEDFDNAREVLGGREGSILDRIGGEFEFDNQMIRLHKEMGRNAPIVLEYGRNIISIEKEDQNESKYTAIYPFATFTPENRDTTQIVSLPEYYVESKYASMYDHRKIQLVDFTTEFDNDNKPTVAKVRELAKKYIESNEVGAPHTNIKVEYVDLAKTLDYEQFEYMEEVELNDRLPIYYPKFDITNNQAKAVVIVYDPVKEENKSIELGVIGQRFGQVLTGNTPERLNKIEKEQKNQMLYVVNAAGNRIWYSTPPDNIEHKIGDTWFDKNGPYMLLKVWNGSQWIVEINTEDVDKVKREVEEVQKGIEEYKNNIDASIDDLNTTIGNTFTSLEGTMNQLSSISEQTRLNAEAARAQSLTALSDAQKAQTNATDALTAARQGLSALEGVESSISTIDYEIDELNGSLSLKASQIDMNKLTGKVEQHTFDISVNAEGLKAKANQSTVDTLSGRVTTLNSELTVQAGLLKSKIGMTEVNAAIDGIEIGVRNLILKSEKTEIYPTTRYNTFKLSEPLLSGETYTISIERRVWITEVTSHNFVMVSLRDAKGDSNINNIGDGVQTPTIPIGGKGLTITVPAGKQIDTVLFYSAHINSNTTGNRETYYGLQITRGNKKNNWTPAPEDIQGQFKSIETDIEQTATAINLKADQTTVDTLNGRVSNLNSQLTVQAGQISGKVSMSEVNTAIDGIEVGGRNFVTDSNNPERYATHAGAKYTYTKNIAVTEWGTKEAVRLVSTGGTSTIKILRSINTNLEEMSINSYTVSVYVKNNSSTDMRVSTNRIGQQVVKGNSTVRVVISSLPSNSGAYLHIQYLTNHASDNLDITVWNPKVEKGTKVTDWTPAPEDLESKITLIESEWKQTANEITGTISSISGEVSLQKQTLTSFTQSLMDPNTGRLVKAEQNLNGLQNTVSNKANQTDVTTLANGFSVLSKQTIQNKINIESDGFVLWSDWSRGSEISSYNVSGEGFAVQQAVNNSTEGGNNRIWYSKESGFLTPGVTYTVTILINSDAVNREFSMGQGNNPGNQRFKLTTTPTKYSFVFEAVNTNTFSVYFHNAGAYRIRNVTVVEGGGASQSQLSVLTNQIDMAVREGDVIGRINIQAGRNLIQNKQIIMDAETVTFTGKAFIPDAAITTMSADKITAGVIDFTEITGININANSITTGTLGGANMDVNLNNSSIELRDPSTQNKLTLVQGRISFSNGTQGRNLLYHEEGLISRPLSGNLGTNKNSMFRLEGGGFGSYQYLQFSEGGSNGRQQRLEAVGDKMSVQVHPGGRFEVRSYGESFADMKAYSYESHHSSGNWLKMVADRIETPGDGRARNIYLKPNGTGIVSISDQNGNNYYNIRASTFLNASSRKLKTNIEESAQGALKVLNALTIVEYNLKSDLQIGVENRQIGLIAEDSLQVASSDGESIDTYRLLSYNTKAIQELSSLQETLEQKIEKRLFNQDSELFTVKSELAQVKSALKEVQKQLNELKGVA